MKAMIREYGQVVISIVSTFGIVKLMEYYFLGSNGIVEILFQCFG